MIKSLLEGFILGISTGTLCLMTCTPVYLPYLMTSDRKLSKSVFAILEISVGRFISYLAFGALAGFAGAQISHINRNFFGSLANILLSVYLLLTVIRTHKADKKCHIPKIASVTKSGLLLGILTGLNFCPAFLIALNNAVNLGGVMSGIFLFGGFFFGTTLYLIPLAFASLFTQISKMKGLARILSLLVAAWFIYKGATGLYQHYHKPSFEGKRTVDVMSPYSRLAVISAESNLPYFSMLRDSLDIKTRKNVPLFTYSQALPDSLLNNDYIFFLDSSQPVLPEFDQFDQILIEPKYDISKIISYLQKFTFLTDNNIKREFTNE